MEFAVWLGFVVASAAVMAVPGPTTLLVISYALGRGRQSAWATAPGVALGDFTAMTISLLGAGAILAASATLFTLLKFVGAAYLIWLGISLWRAPATLDDPKADAPGRAGKARDAREMFWNAYVVTALNPKSIAFFVAFVPQFVDPGAPLVMQFAILEATFIAMAAGTAVFWAMTAGRLRDRLRKPSALRTVRRIGGGFMIGAGVLTAAAQRGA